MNIPHCEKDASQNSQHRAVLRPSLSTNIDVFSTSPQSSAVDRASYLRNVIDVAHWSEDAGCKGILVYTDNSLVDPWLVAQVIIDNTAKLCPLVAVQPAYMHPYTVSKMVSSFAYLYARSLYLNMVAGGFLNDLDALNDTTPHDKRYSRLVEYTTIIKQLLQSRYPVTYNGEFYKVNNLRMIPQVPSELFPGIFVSGSSEAGLRAARAIGATAIKYPQPASEYGADFIDPDVDSGVRVGIIAREREDDAWRVAHERFPEDRKGQLMHQLAMKVSDSQWHEQLSQTAQETTLEPSPYWLVPFLNYKTFCPYLVGSYERVAGELTRYVDCGYKTFILDIPSNREELQHINIVFSALHIILPNE
jgi:alkanesulfonate monooxygenase